MVWRVAVMVLASVVGVAQPEQDSPSPGAKGVPDHSKKREIAGPLVSMEADGKLAYKAWDERGDVIPDFSMCGYRGGKPLPQVETVAEIGPVEGGGDDTARIQAAVDAVGQRTMDAKGFRGALLLKAGVYRVAGTIKIGQSGVVLRGEGMGTGGTKIIATGAAERPLILVSGASGVKLNEKGAVGVAEGYVPVGAKRVKVKEAGKFKVGDSVMVRREGNGAWIHFLQMDQLITRPGTKQWEPFAIDMDRMVVGVEGDTLVLDAPIVCAIDAQWGGGSVIPYSDEGRIVDAGVENLAGDSEFDASVTSTVGVKDKKPYPADEKHAIDLVNFANCKDCWGTQLSAKHFYNGVSRVSKSGKRVTVQDCEASEAVSIITGGRRYPFCTEGQLNLYLRCKASGMRHAFVNNGSHAPGPNAFVDCVSEDNFADSGPHQRWSTGTLYDNIVGVMHSQDRQDMGSGHGWAGANDVYWNCRGSITIEQPQTAENFAFGFVGEKQKPAFAQIGHPEGYYESFGKAMPIRSLYFAQLAERVGEAGARAVEGRK